MERDYEVEVKAVNSAYLIGQIKKEPLMPTTDETEKMVNEVRQDERNRIIGIILQAPVVDMQRVIRCSKCRNSKQLSNGSFVCTSFGDSQVPADGYCHKAL